MEPISLGLGVIGLGMQLFGSSASAGVSRQMANVSSGIAADEQQINAQKLQQTQLQARRMQLENMRNVQRLRAQATASAVNQGANFGSGLSGGLGQITSQGTSNALGINQNLQIAQNVFGINNDISGKRMQMAQLQGQMASDQGIASLGQSIMKSGPIIGQFGKDASAGLSDFGTSLNWLNGGPTGFLRG